VSTPGPGGLLLLLLAAPVRAEEPPTHPPTHPPTVAPQDEVEQAATEARRAEREGQPAQEHAACEVVVAAARGDRAEQACHERLAVLDAQVDPGGGWEGLARLEAARRIEQPTTRRLTLGGISGDPAVARAVRAQAGAALAALALAREDPEGALNATEPWWPGEDLPETVRRRVGGLRAEALQRLNQSGGAEAIEEELPGPTQDALAPTRTDQRRRRLRGLSDGVVAVWAIVGLPLATRGWAQRPQPRPLGLVPLAVVGGGGLVMVAVQAPELAGPFALLLATLAMVYLLSAGGALALQPRPRLRALFGLGSALATLGCIFLVLDALHLLDRVGL